jgi:3-oxoacyl-[acyl-carrier protein] reductase
MQMKDFRLDEHVAIVTGAGRGIGAGIAMAYAQAGADIVLVARTPSQLDAVAARIRASGRKAITVAGDVRDPTQAPIIVARAVAELGRLDVVVNNAGITYRNQPMLNVDEATYDRVFAVNVKSIYWSAIHAVPVFRRQGAGCFVNIASTAGLRPRPGLTWYNASKGAVIMMSKSMAVELAPDRIRVNAICPVIGETGLTAEFMGGDTPELRAKFVATIPLGRMSLPKDIAAASLFLASDEAEFLTGVALEVDGGRCI